ncbi:MAG TPA: RDD family protein [Burkholderiales bacterium]|nr:RDD family protein [Burkholderiales bacterium]
MSPAHPPHPVSPESRPERRAAPFGRRILSLVYETLLLAAVLWLVGFVYAAIENALGLAHVRPLFQLYLLLVAGIYFVWQWARGGQTLPMKTWHMRLVGDDGRPVTYPQAGVRYAAAVAGTALFGLGFVWALFDRDGKFLHDRLAGTRIVRT